MNRVVIMLLFLGLLSGVSSVSAEEAVPEEPGKWEKAGKEISEAADAVGDATVDSSKKAWKATKEGSAQAYEATKEGAVDAYEATKEGSAKAWKATKEKSHELMEEGRQKVHEATAPKPETPEGE